MAQPAKQQTVDEYIKAQPKDVQTVLQRVRRTLHDAAPGAEEKILYDIPTLTLNGKRLVHFAAWKEHLGVYPVPKGDDAFARAIDPYRAGKGTLRFPFREPIPYELIARAVAHLVAERHRR